ncbi:MAG: transposase [Gammaproteobacteria bacterium]|nr:transposase [Gammaproteobacteria bacterium]
MAIARQQLINIESTPYYHCTSRCVRRAFLCGKDDYSGRCYEHRRDWVESLLLKMAAAFCIDVVAYAVMSNHYHVILRVDLELAQSLTDVEIIERWAKIYKPDAVMCGYRDGLSCSDEQREYIETTVAKWRSTLSNISRFMGYLNERIAKEANREDDCTGRFWEGRFHSQALLDEAALLRSMTYVDLNPVRAGVAAVPEESEYTSVKHRIEERRMNQQSKNTSSVLMDFRGPHRQGQNGTPVSSDIEQESAETLPLSFTEYLELLDWSSRVLREDKVGAVTSSTPEILDRLGYGPEQWTSFLRPPTSWRPKALGSPETMQGFCQAINQHWVCQTNKTG